MTTRVYGNLRFVTTNDPEHQINLLPPHLAELTLRAWHIRTWLDTNPRSLRYMRPRRDCDGYWVPSSGGRRLFRN